MAVLRNLPGALAAALFTQTCFSSLMLDDLASYVVFERRDSNVQFIFQKTNEVICLAERKALFLFHK